MTCAICDLEMGPGQYHHRVIIPPEHVHLLRDIRPSCEPTYIVTPDGAALLAFCIGCWLDVDSRLPAPRRDRATRHLTAADLVRKARKRFPPLQ